LHDSFGFFDNLPEITPFGVAKQNLQITGEPELYVVQFMDIILKIFVEH